MYQASLGGGWNLCAIQFDLGPAYKLSIELDRGGLDLKILARIPVDDGARSSGYKELKVSGYTPIDREVLELLSAEGRGDIPARSV